MNILVATCRDQIESHGNPRTPDDIALLAALRERGIAARVAAWDDGSVEWSRADLVLIRSTWDYHSDLAKFLAWVEQVTKQSVLWNPFTVIRWNAHKSYQHDLAQQGVPIVPTRLILQGSVVSLEQIMRAHDWQHVMIKPAVAANAAGAKTFDLRQISDGQMHLNKLLVWKDVLVQPFLPSIQQVGEHSLICIDGNFSQYTICKRSMTRSTGTTSGDEELLAAHPDELQFAQQVLHAAAESLRLTEKHWLFARVDLIRDEMGELRLMELEMIEPRLYFDLQPQLAEQLVDALVARISLACLSTQKRNSHDTAHASRNIAVSMGR